MLSAYKATPQEIAAPLPGDALVAADLAVNSALVIPGAPPEEVWPWVEQAGKGRAGWYQPYWVEDNITPARWHGSRIIVPDLQGLQVGDTMGDWSGKDAVLKVAIIEPPTTLVYEGHVSWTSLRARLARKLGIAIETEPREISFSWALILGAEGDGTRIHSRTRVAPVEHLRTTRALGGFLDRAVAAGFAGGLRDRIAANRKTDV
jgi:hypothetical protein